MNNNYYPDIVFICLSSFGFRAVDISNPSNPVLLAITPDKGSVKDAVIVRGRKEFIITASGSGTTIFEISNLNEPGKLVARVPTNNSLSVKAVDVNCAGDLLYFAAIKYGGVAIYDIQKDIKNPELLSIYYSYGVTTVRASRIKRELVYVANGYEGLVALDVSNPRSPIPFFWSAIDDDKEKERRTSGY